LDTPAQQYAEMAEHLELKHAMMVIVLLLMDVAQDATLNLDGTAVLQI